MQSAPSRVWTRVAMSISYDDNHYTTGTSLINYYKEIFLIQIIYSDMISSILIQYK